MPIIYLNMLITVGLGLAVGYSVSFIVIKLGRVRNGSLAIIYALAASLIVIWFQWAIWIVALFEDVEMTFSNVSSLLMSPTVMFEIMADINEEGTFSIGRRGSDSGMVNGTMLTLIWIAEALIIIVASVIKPINQAKQPYCEKHNKWFQKNEVMKLDLVENPQELIDGLEKMDEEVAGKLSVNHEPNSTHHSTWQLYTCDGDDHYLTVDNMIGKMNEKKKIEFERTPIVHLFRINTKMKDAILA
jgi:hypothetical protein